jgi:hypothetical protein
MALLVAGCAGPNRPQAPEPSVVGAEPGEEIRANWPQVRLNTPYGPQTFYYQVEDGLAIAEGDIMLGPVEVIEAIAEGRTSPGSAAFALANTSPDALWPNGRVPFVFAPDAPHQADIQAMIAEYNARTPVQFVARNGEYHHVEFTSSPINNYGQIGRQWWGATKVGISPTMAAGATAQTVIVHELGHAIGLYHEHTRKDRDSFVTINWPCVNPVSYGNFFRRTDAVSVDLERYDTTSVMHYTPTAFSMDGTCVTVEVQDGVPPIFRTNRLSISDVNALWKLYGKFDSSNGEGDMFGHAMVAADFDGDGHTDLAVGAPMKTIDGMQRRGAVYLFKGTDTTFAPWGMLDFSTHALPAAGDRFGYALAVGDFNNDGVPDLAVGVPGRDAGQGAVAVFRGRRGRPLSMFSFHTAQSHGLGSYGAGGLGTSLAIGDVNGDGFADIAAGAPSGLRPDRQVNSGYVYVLRGSELGHTQGLVIWERSSQGNFGSDSESEAGDRFGAALQMADWNGDGLADLAVGAPRDRNGNVTAGAVFLFAGNAAGPQAERRITAPEADRTMFTSFGASLASADWNGDGQPELAIGAPGANVGAVLQTGKVYFANPRANPVIYGELDQTGLGQNEIGDNFGITLHASDLDGDGDADLIVGATGEATMASGQPRQGMAMGYRNNTGALEPWFRLFAVSADTDRNFGIAIASGDFDDNNETDIVVGASLSRLEHASAPRSGVVHYFRNFRQTGGILNPTSTLHQTHRWLGLIHEAEVNP